MPLATSSRTRRLGLALLVLAPWFTARADLADLIAAAKPSVVAVGTYNPTANPRFTFRGTGFAVADGNTVVTNLHVLPPVPEGAASPPLTVQVRNARQQLEPRSARLLSTDREHDIVLLRIDGAPLPPLMLGDNELVREGTAVAFTGFPIGGVLGFSPVTHHGIVSSVANIVLPAANARQLSERAVAQLRDGPFDIYQLDGTAYPGNSGGPLFDASSGRVIGVVNMVLVRDTKESALSRPTGISYAIPVRYVRQLIERP